MGQGSGPTGGRFEASLGLCAWRGDSFRPMADSGSNGWPYEPWSCLIGVPLASTVSTPASCAKTPRVFVSGFSRKHTVVILHPTKVHFLQGPNGPNPPPQVHCSQVDTKVIINVRSSVSAKDLFSIGGRIAVFISIRMRAFDRHGKWLSMAAVIVTEG